MQMVDRLRTHEEWHCAEDAAVAIAGKLCETAFQVHNRHCNARQDRQVGQQERSCIQRLSKHEKKFRLTEKKKNVNKFGDRSTILRLGSDLSKSELTSPVDDEHHGKLGRVGAARCHDEQCD